MILLTPQKMQYKVLSLWISLILQANFRGEADVQFYLLSVIISDGWLDQLQLRLEARYATVACVGV